MGEIATSERQITLFYNGKSVRAKQALAYAETEGFKIQKIDILKNPPTGTQLIELARRLNVEMADLVNQEHPSYYSKFAHHELSDEDWAKMIRKNPEILKQPIAIHGKQTLLIETPTDMLKI